MLAVVLATVGVVAAGYEWVAVRTRRVPTITHLVKAMPFWPRLMLATVLPAYLWVDHVWLEGWGVP